MSENGTAAESTSTKYPAVRVGALGHDAAAIVASLGFTKDDPPAAIVATWYELVDLMAGAVEDLIDETAPVAPAPRSGGGGGGGGGGVRILNSGDREATGDPVPDWALEAFAKDNVTAVRDYRGKLATNDRHPHFKSADKIGTNRDGQADYKAYWPPRKR